LIKGHPSLLASDSSRTPAKLNSCSQIGEASRKQVITAQMEMVSLVGFPSSCCTILSVESLAHSLTDTLTDSLARFSQGIHSLYSLTEFSCLTLSPNSLSNSLPVSVVVTLSVSLADSLTDSVAAFSCCFSHWFSCRILSPNSLTEFAR